MIDDMRRCLATFHTWIIPWIPFSGDAVFAPIIKSPSLVKSTVDTSEYPSAFGDIVNSGFPVLVGATAISPVAKIVAAIHFPSGLSLDGSLSITDGHW
jgi:hypothetical protein